MNNIIVIFTCFSVLIFNTCLLLCCTYLTIKFNSVWFMFFLFFMRDFKYNSKSDDKEEDKKEEP